LASEKFKKVDFGLTEKNTNVQYASINEIAVKINSLVELAHRWIRSQAQQQQAFRAGARLKLDDTHKELDQERQLFENTAGRKKILSDQIYNAEINGESVSVEKSELEQLNAGLEVARLKIDELAQEKVRLEKTLQDFKGRGMSAERKQIYVDEFISPLLKGLESIKAYGSRVRSESDMLEGALFLDVQENQ